MFYAMSKDSKPSRKRIAAGVLVEISQLLWLSLSTQITTLPQSTPFLDWIKWIGSIVSASSWIGDSPLPFLFWIGISATAALIAIGAYVGWGYHHNSLHSLAPVRLLRTVGSLIATAGFIPLLSLVSIGWKAPWADIFTIVMSVMFAILLSAIALAFVLIFYDADPESPSGTARPHSRINFYILLVKCFAVITSSGVLPLLTAEMSQFVGLIYLAVLAVAACVATGAFVVFLPYYSLKFTVLRACASGFWTGFAVQAALGAWEVSSPSGGQFWVMQALWTLLPGVMIGVWWKLFVVPVAQKAGKSSKVPGWIPHPMFVEVLARAIVQSGMGERSHKMGALKLMEVARAKHPESKSLIMTQALYEYSYAKTLKRVRTALSRAESHSLPFDGEFLVYKLTHDLERRLATRSESSSTNDSEGFDFLAQLAFRRSLDSVRASHTAAMRHVRSFWKIVAQPEVDFVKLQTTSSLVMSSTEAAAKTLAALQAKFPNSPSVLRAQAIHALELKQNYVLAESLFTRAKTLEDDDASRRTGRGGMRGLKERSAFIGIHLDGSVQVVSSQLCDMFDYARQDLIGRHVKMLVPAVLASQVDGRLGEVGERLAEDSNQDDALGGLTGVNVHGLGMTRSGTLFETVVKMSTALLDGEDVIVGEVSAAPGVAGEASSQLFVCHGQLIGCTRTAEEYLGYMSSEMDYAVSTLLPEIELDELDLEAMSIEAAGVLPKQTMLSRESGVIEVAPTIRPLGWGGIVVIGFDVLETEDQQQFLSGSDSTRSTCWLDTSENDTSDADATRTSPSNHASRPRSRSVPHSAPPRVATRARRGSIGPGAFTGSPLASLREESNPSGVVSPSSSVRPSSPVGNSRPLKRFGGSSVGARSRMSTRTTVSDSRWNKYRKRLKKKQTDKGSGITTLKNLVAVVTVLFLVVAFWFSQIGDSVLKTSMEGVGTLEYAGQRSVLTLQFSTHAWMLAESVMANDGVVAGVTEAELREEMAHTLGELDHIQTLLFAAENVREVTNVPGEIDLDLLDETQTSVSVGMWEAMERFRWAGATLLDLDHRPLLNGSALALNESSAFYFITHNTAEAFQDSLGVSQDAYVSVLDQILHELVIAGEVSLGTTLVIVVTLSWCTLKPVTELVSMEKKTAMSVFTLLDPTIIRGLTRRRRADLGSADGDLRSARGGAGGDEQLSDDSETSTTTSDDDPQEKDGDMKSSGSRRSHPSRRGGGGGPLGGAHRRIVGMEQGSQRSHGRYALGGVVMIIAFVVYSVSLFGAYKVGSAAKYHLADALSRQALIDEIELRLVEGALVGCDLECHEAVDERLDHLREVQEDLFLYVMETFDTTHEDHVSHASIMFDPICELPAEVFVCSSEQEADLLLREGFGAVLQEYMEVARGLNSETEPSALNLSSERLLRLIDLAEHVLDPLAAASTHVVDVEWAESLEEEDEQTVGVAWLTLLMIVAGYAACYRPLVVELQTEMVSIAGMIDMVPLSAVEQNVKIRTLLNAASKEGNWSTSGGTAGSGAEHDPYWDGLDIVASQAADVTVDDRKGVVAKLRRVWKIMSRHGAVRTAGVSDVVSAVFALFVVGAIVFGVWVVLPAPSRMLEVDGGVGVSSFASGLLGASSPVDSSVLFRGFEGLLSIGESDGHGGGSGVVHDAVDDHDEEHSVDDGRLEVGELWTLGLVIDSVAGGVVLCLVWFIGIPVERRVVEFVSGGGILGGVGVYYLLHHGSEGIATDDELYSVLLFLVPGLLIGGGFVQLGNGGKGKKGQVGSLLSAMAGGTATPTTRSELVMLGFCAGGMAGIMGGSFSPIVIGILILWYRVESRIAMFTACVCSGIVCMSLLLVHWIASGGSFGESEALPGLQQQLMFMPGVVVGGLALHVTSGKVAIASGSVGVGVLVVHAVIVGAGTVAVQLGAVVLCAGGTLCYLTGVGGLISKTSGSSGSTSDV